MADKVETKVIKSTFLLRRGDESKWQGKTLNEGEPGFAKDNGVLKVGQKENGQLMTWENLPTIVTQDYADSHYIRLNGNTSNLNMNSHKITNLTDPTSTQDAATKGYTDTTIKSSLDSLRTWLTADNMDNILPWPYYAMTTTKTSTSAGGNPCEINGMTYNVDETGWVHVTGGQLTYWVNYYFANSFKFIPGLYNLSWVCVNYDDGIGTTKRSIVAPFVYVAPSTGYVFTPINGIHTLVKQEDVPSGTTTSPTVSAIGNGSKIRINNEINLNIYQQYGYEGLLPVSSGKFKLKLQRVYE